VSFLAPLFLLGALAVALPILFHLIRRTTRDRVPFSSLMFLQTTPPRVTRRSRLENVLLLLLRCLILSLLALGFARPFVQRLAHAGLGSSAASRVILLVDSSASMRRSGLWAEAQTKVQETLKKIAPEDQVALFTFDREVHRLVTFEQWATWSAGDRAALAIRRLASTTPGWADTHLGSALVAAAESFEESARQEQPGGARRIVLVSDLAEGSRLDQLQGYEWPRGIELTVEPLKSKRPTNAGLQRVTDRDETEKPAPDVPVRVRVSNSTDARREQFQIGWSPPDGKGFLGAPVDIYVPPGQSRVATAPKPVGESDHLVLGGDDEDFDNMVFVVPPKAEHVSVLFTGTDLEKDPAQALYYLQRAFQETRRQLVQVVAPGADLALSTNDLADAPFMVLTDPVPNDRLRAAQQFLQQGKTLLFVMKSPAAAAPISTLVGAGAVGAEEAAADRYALLARIDFEHPLFAPFADPRFSDFTKIHFWKHRRIATNSLPGARVLARFDSGDPALLQVPVGQGTLLLLTSGWHPADSQLALSSKFVPLLYSMLEMSGGLKSRRAPYVVGDPVSLPAGLAKGAPKLSVRKPDGAITDLPAGELTFAQTDQPGIYTVTPGQPPFRFAVNLAPEESKTAPLPLEELERLGVPLRIQSALAAKQASEREALLRAAELENRQKLWRWLLVAALLVLLVETWLAGWVTQRSTAAPIPAHS
jgi:hypothetical protein